MGATGAPGRALMILYVGDRVYVRAAWSSFHGLRGVVLTCALPGRVSVRLDGDMFPVLLFRGEVEREEGEH